MAKDAKPGLITKSSLMLGVGEQDNEVVQALQGEFCVAIYRLKGCQCFLIYAELRKANVDVVTFGQYMRPTKRHMKVHAYIPPEKFDHWSRVAESMGFLYVASGPLVRSSFKVCKL